ncbi:MAG: PIN domain-containing protein [Pseudomonadota bacterium]
MAVLIDACVLYPTVLRRLVIGAAEAGLLVPLWSPRILEEWARAAAREGYEIEARGEIARLKAAFPDAEIAREPQIEARLSLPDPDDVHVLAAAITGGANELLTLNIRDFPIRTLAAHGIMRRHPDEFLLEAYHAGPAFGGVIAAVYARAQADGLEMSLRGLLKKSRLPRLGKAVTAT